MNQLRLLFLAFLILCPAEANILSEAVRLKNSGRYMEALDLYLEKRAQAYSASWLMDVSQILIRLQNFPMASIYLQELLNQFPDAAEAVPAHKLLSDLVRYYTGEDLYHLHRELDTYLARAREAAAAGEYHRAILHLLMGQKNKPDDYETKFLIGAAYYGVYKQSGKDLYFQKSIHYFRKAAETIPSAKAFNNLACLLAQSKDVIMARYYFDKALAAAEMPGLRRAIEANSRIFEASEERELFLYLTQP